ncbi:MAG: Pycsar system effector family protein [Flavobacteriaceae bacterium]
MSSSQDPDKSTKSIAPYSKEGHREELVDHYWGSINYVFSLIRASEIKAGLILSFYGILLNLIYQNVEMLLAEASDRVLIYIPLALWVLSTVGSIYFSIRCFMPRMETKFDKNIFFFQDVITKYGSINEFSKTFYNISLNEVELFDQLGQQIYINSKIAAMKFKSVNKSIYLLAVGLFFLFIIAVWYLVLHL